MTNSITFLPSHAPLKLTNHRPRRHPKCSRCQPNACDLPSSRKAPAAIRARNVNFTWPNGRQALVDINFDVFPGELVMIVGRNGCGKSTLLSVLRSLIFPDRGTVHVEPICAYIKQDPNSQILFPTIGSDVLTSVPDSENKTSEQARKEVHDVLEYVGLVPTQEFYDKSSYRLSGGQQQRAVLAAALVRKPKTFLFDEVTASIDPISRADLLDRVRKLVSDFNVATIW